MWFRYFITFIDLLLSMAIVCSCMKHDLEKNKSVFICGAAMVVAFISSVILMWWGVK